MVYRARTIPIKKVAGGRYEFTSTIDGLDPPASRLRAYGLVPGAAWFPYSRLAFPSALLPVPLDAPQLDAVSSLAKSEFILHLDRYEAAPKDTVSGRLEWLTSAQVYYAMSEEADKRGKNPAFEVEFAVIRTRDNVLVHGMTLPLRLYGPAPTFQLLKPGALPPGRYQVHTRVRSVGGELHDVILPNNYYSGLTMGGFPTVPLLILEKERSPIPTTVADAPNLLTKAARIGNPAMSKFGENHSRDAFARTVYDMQQFEGRIYLSCGDISRNRGPVPVWSFAPRDVANGTGFAKEFIVDDDAIEMFRVVGDTLYAPGADSSGGQSWDAGNLYTKRGGSWTKLRTVPNGIHVFDATEWRGKLFTVTGTLKGGGLHESTDRGRTWQSRHVARVMRFRQVQPAPDGSSLLLIPEWGKLGPYRFRGESLEPLHFDLFPGVALDSSQTANHLTPFLNGFVYGINLGYYPLSFDQPRPLFALTDFEQGPHVVELFAHAVVTDLFARDDRCYVLTAKPDGDGFLGEIHASTDLKSWIRLARFHVPAVPFSFEELDGQWFVGLGARDRTLLRLNDPASGEIYRIE